MMLAAVLFLVSALLADSRSLGVANFRLRYPDNDGLSRRSARWLDAAIDTIVRAPLAPGYRERRDGRDWPDVAQAQRRGATSVTVWRAPDRTPVITAAAPLAPGLALMSTVNARDVTERVRQERFRLSVVVLVAAGSSRIRRMSCMAGAMASGAGRGNPREETRPPPGALRW